MWSSRKASSRDEAAVIGGLIVKTAHPRILSIGWTSLTILSVLAASPEPVVKMATLSLAACNSSSTFPTNQSCECFSGPAPIAPPGSRRSIGSRNRQGSPSRSGRTGRPEPTPRRDSLIQRVRSRAGRTRWRRGENSSSQTRRSCAQPKRPRRMGRCGEVADDGEKSGGPPRPRNRYVCRKAAVSALGSALCEIRVEPLNLLQSVQTYFCLGHCITRGIGLRRQASILRLSGAALSRALSVLIESEPGSSLLF
jgi:hypothetical protein